ncbi:MAG TPA: hypothetical protein VD930_12160 [Gemmatimonadales bacterium]|nr:hypothetical protein [Gemmatimonadales bacterium]
MARRREADRPALLRPELFLPADLRPPDRDDFRVLLRAELRPPPREDLLDFLADRRALFLAPLRADFRLPLLADRLADFLRVPPLRDPPLRDRLVPPVLRLGDGSSKSKDDGDDEGEEGEGEGVLSEGRGSIHPEPDQPISI